MENNTPHTLMPSESKVVIIEKNKRCTMVPWWLLMVVLILVIALISLGGYCYNLRVSSLSIANTTPHEVPIDAAEENMSDASACLKNTCVETANEMPEEYFQNSDGMVFPDSSVEYLTDDDLTFLKDYDDESKQIILQMAINELYARHGFLFGKQEVLEYYSQYYWYCGTKNMDAARQEFNDIERRNADFLVLWLENIS